MSGQTLTKDPFAIRMLGTAALVEKLGIDGAVTFLQYGQNKGGRGDYARDRHEWLDKLSFDDICDGIEEIERRRAIRC